MYNCKVCGETWPINMYDGLIPSRYPNGAWYLDEGKQDNCPGCCEKEVDTTGSWVFAEPNDAYYRYIVNRMGENG